MKKSKETKDLNLPVLLHLDVRAASPTAIAKITRESVPSYFILTQWSHSFLPMLLKK